MASIAIACDGQPTGEVSWAWEGENLHVRATCPFEAEYIYRVQLLAAGQTLNLGVMAPEGDSFVLKREIRDRRWRHILASEAPVEARVVKALPGQTPTEHPGGPLDRYRSVPEGFSSGDDSLNRALAGKAGCLYIIDGNMLHLAYPLEIGGRSDFAPFFALTHYVQLAGQGYGQITLPQPAIV